MCLSSISNTLNIFDKTKNMMVWIFKNKKKFSKMSHYFKNYHKHVTIYENGNGIIINSFDIVFNDYKTEFLVRALNIEDGKKIAKFEKLEDMKKTKLSDRFDKYGFWMYSSDSIITTCEEKYWTSDGLTEDIKARNNTKELRWVFNFNRSKIKLNTPYHVVYILSVPNMYPIKNGLLDISSINDENSKNSSSTSIEIENAVEHLTYTVSFASGIKLDVEPNSTLTELKKVSKNTHPLLKSEYNIIYNKYTCSIDKPQLGSKLKIAWRFKGGK